MPSNYIVTDTETGEVRETPATYTEAVRAADYWLNRTYHMHVVKAAEPTPAPRLVLA